MREKACLFSYLRCKLKGFFTPLLLKKVKAHLRGGGLFDREGLFNLEGTMISVLFKELEHKVEKLKNKKAGGHAAE